MASSTSRCPAASARWSWVSTRPCGPRSSTSRRAARSSSSRSSKVVHPEHRGGTGRSSVPPRCIIRDGGSHATLQAHRRCDGGGPASRCGDRLARRFPPRVRSRIDHRRRSPVRSVRFEGRQRRGPALPPELHRLLPRQGRRAVPSAQAAGVEARAQLRLLAHHQGIAERHARLRDHHAPGEYLEAGRLRPFSGERGGQVTMSRYRLALATCVVLVTVWLAALEVDAASLVAVKERGWLRECAHPEALPFSSQDRSQPGFQLEIAEAIAKILGVRVIPEWIVYTRHARRADCDAVIGAVTPLTAEDKAPPGGGVLPTRASAGPG